MKFVGIIPARYASTRFPGKPLVDINGKPMIQRVYESVSESTRLSNVVVATDDQRIFDAVEGFGGNVEMTLDTHHSGTDRCEECINKVGGEFDFAINIQGDEPFIDARQIDQLCDVMLTGADIGTLVMPITNESDFLNPNKPKVVFDNTMRALYFSRAPLPYLRSDDASYKIGYRHIGMYGYAISVLHEIVKLPISEYEKIEKLEQLRWLQNGYTIMVGITEIESQAVDTPQDLERLLKSLE